MGVLESLVSTAEADVDLLRVRNGQGDIFSYRRPVDFVFLAPNKSQADAVAGFLVDYRYANTSVSPSDDAFCITATIVMCLEQQEILSVSGFMRCIAALFSVTYDGWGASVATAA